MAANLHRLVNLETLDVAGYDFSGVSALSEALNALTALRSLQLAGCSLTGMKALAPSLLSRLHKFTTGWCHDEDGWEMDVYPHMTQLRDLDVQHRMDDRSLAALAGLTALETLDLWGSFTEQGVRALAGMSRLRELALKSDPPLGCAGVEALTSALASTTRLTRLDLPANEIADSGLNAIVLATLGVLEEEEDAGGGWPCLTYSRCHLKWHTCFRLVIQDN